MRAEVQPERPPYNQQAFPHDHPDHLRALRAKSHAHPDLGSTAMGAIGQRAVETGRNQKSGEGAEKSSETGEHRWLGIRHLKFGLLGHRFFQGSIRVDLVHRFCTAGINFGIV